MTKAVSILKPEASPPVRIEITVGPSAGRPRPVAPPPRPPVFVGQAWGLDGSRRVVVDVSLRRRVIKKHHTHYWSVRWQDATGREKESSAAEFAGWIRRGATLTE